jgi:hypothetical protein
MQTAQRALVSCGDYTLTALGNKANYSGPQNPDSNLSHTPLEKWGIKNDESGTKNIRTTI